jgi:hypothetical protein
MSDVIVLALIVSATMAALLLGSLFIERKHSV